MEGGRRRLEINGYRQARATRCNLPNDQQELDRQTGVEKLCLILRGNSERKGDRDRDRQTDKLNVCMA